MALSTRIQPISRDIELLIQEELTPRAQSKVFADFAKEQIDDAKNTNRSILGRIPRYTVTVDGHEGAPLESVRPNGTIIAEFDLANDMLSWIGEQLVLHSPVKSGAYQSSHALLADGVLVAVGQMVPPADEYVFVNSQPYARKIETGSSSQAPDGVYQAVATMANKRFNNVAKVSFSFRSVLFGGVNSWASSASGARHAAKNKAHSGTSASSRSEWLRRQPAVIVNMRGSR